MLINQKLILLVYIGIVFSHDHSITRHWESPTYSMQFPANTPNYSMMFPLQQSSQIRPFIPQVQWPHPQQHNYNTSIILSNTKQAKLGTTPFLLSSIPSDQMIPSSIVVTAVTTVTSSLSTLHSSGTYSQPTTVDTLMSTVQCGSFSQHRSLYSVRDHPTTDTSFQVGLNRLEYLKINNLKTE